MNGSEGKGEARQIPSDEEINRMAGLTADLPTTVPLTDSAHCQIGEARLSTNEQGDMVMDATLSDLPEEDLPGMWSRSDFTGGIETVKAISERASATDPFPLGSASAAEATQTLEGVEVRRGSWLDRLVNRSYTDRFLQALADQGWHLEPWLAPDESAYGWFAYPPGAVTDDRRYVLVPGRIEPGRAAANLVAALRRASGSFNWEE